MKLSRVIVWFTICLNAFTVFASQAAGYDDEGYSKSEMHKFSEKRSEITQKMVPFLRGDREKLKQMHLEAVKNYNVKKAPLHVAENLNSAAIFAPDRLEGLKLYAKAADILLAAKVKTKYDERFRAMYLHTSASGGFANLIITNPGVVSFEGEKLEIAKKFIEAQKASCEFPDDNLKRPCDINLDFNSGYRKVLAATGDKLASEIEEKFKTQTENKNKKFKSLASELTEASTNKNHAAVLSISSKILSEFEKELSWANFLKSIIYADRAVSYSKLNKPAERDAAFETANSLIRNQLILDISYLEAQQQMAEGFGLNKYARLLSVEVRALKQMGDFETGSAEIELMSTDAETTRKMGELRDTMRKRAKSFQDLEAVMCAEWSLEKYKTYDLRYREMTKEVAAEQQRLQREAEEDRRRSRENRNLFISALGEASNILSGKQTGPSEEFIRATQGDTTAVLTSNDFSSASTGDVCRGEALRNIPYENAMAQLSKETTKQLRGAIVGMDLMLNALEQCQQTPSIAEQIQSIKNSKSQSLNTCRSISSNENLCGQSPF